MFSLEPTHRLSPLSPCESARATRDDNLLLVSNRGPLTYEDEAGETSRPTGGGVAVALRGIADLTQTTWVAAASSPQDCAVARRQLHEGRGSSNLRLVDMPSEVYEPFYNGFCNPLLWFVQHSLSGELTTRAKDNAFDSWRNGYVPANQKFAAAVVEEAQLSRGEPRVMLHDYHLYLAARMVRNALPGTMIQHYVHIPWPRPPAWFALPSCVVRQICAGLLAADSVCFQTDESLDNFFESCHSYLGDEVDIIRREGVVEYEGRRTSVSSNPISVDVDDLIGLRESATVQRYKRELEVPEGMATILRVDRLDPAKNALKGFEAYALLLQENPFLRGRVRFLAFLVPSRRGIAEYDDYADRVFGNVQRINRLFGTPDWTPIQVIHEDNREKALAALCLYDVLLVNSVADGMNLVSKEGPIVNERSGVLVLSQAAGSYQELGPASICIDPKDVRGTAEALKRALTTRPAERVEQSERLRMLIERHQLMDWHRHLMQDLAVAGGTEPTLRDSRPPGGASSARFIRAVRMPSGAISGIASPRRMPDTW